MPTELSRSLLTILIPGLVAVSPWLLALVQYTPATLGFGSYGTLAHAMLFSLVVVVGSVFQGLGSFLEVRWDKEREGEFEVKECWFAYLASSSSPVGHRYLSRLVTLLYFEIGMFQAVVPFAIGAALLAQLRFPQLSPWLCLLTPLVVSVPTVYFYWQARCTHKALCETRQQLQKRISGSGQNLTTAT